jgi:hypothetical protein
MRDNRCITYAGRLPQCRFNIAGLNPVTSYFYLVVDASKIFKRPVERPAAQITSAVHSGPGFRAEGICHKTFGRQPRLIEVAPGKSDSRNMYLASYPYRRHLELLV